MSPVFDTKQQSAIPPLVDAKDNQDLNDIVLLSSNGHKYNKLVVMIPALNEAQTIGSVIEQIPQRIDGIEKIEVIVVNDGSTDDTAEVARKAGADVVSHHHNKGLGIAFATGIETALKKGADIVVNIDGDGQFDPKDIAKLVQPIIDGKAEFVTCSRFAKQELIPQMPLVKKLGNRLMTKVINRLTHQSKFTDVSCGFRAYTREAILKINLFGYYTYTHETLIDLLSHGISVAEVPLKVRGVRQYGKSRVAKNLFKYGWHTSLIIFRTMRDIKPLSFFGGIGVFIFIIGLLLGAFVFMHWLFTGYTSPYKSVLIGSAVGLILGFLLLVLALLADMIGRIRKILELLLYYSKKSH